MEKFYQIMEFFYFKRVLSGVMIYKNDKGDLKMLGFELEGYDKKLYLEDKRASLILVVVCFITYVIIALTRNAYGAAIVSIINEGYFTKSAAGIIAASFNITYCISQIIGSYFVDRISPFKIILFGAVVTVFANVTMSVNPDYWTIFIARAICGIAQFGIWPSLLKILSEYVNEDHRHTWRYILPLGVTAGSVLSYLGAALITQWRGLFTLSYVLMAIMTVVFAITAVYANKKAVPVNREVNVSEVISRYQSSESAQNINVFKLLASSGVFLLVIPIFVKSLINGGILSWLPTIIMESYNVSPAISSTMTTISTCVNLGAVLWVILLYPRVFKLQTTAMGMMFLFMLPFFCLSVFVGKLPMIMIVAFITIANTFLGALNQFCTVEIPGAYTKYNKAGMVAGLINSVCTLSAVISSWLWGKMADSFDWNVITALWTALTLVSMLICFAATPLWKNFVQKK